MSERNPTNRLSAWILFITGTLMSGCMGFGVAIIVICVLVLGASLGYAG